jgi:hypothetical protein
MNKQILTIALLAPLFSGCVAAAVGVVGGVLLSQEVLEDATYVGRVKQDAHRTWASAKTSLSHASLKPIETNNAARTATGEVDGAKVVVAVATTDLNECEIRVSAKKYGVANGEIARMVFDKILADLDR